jgi:LCP family protein required for cell wall assembly
MSGTSVDDFFGRQAKEARGPEPEGSARRKPSRRRRRRRIAIASVVTALVLVVGIAGSGLLLVNHLASNVQRIHGITALTALDQPVMPAATRKSMTVLLTSSPKRPTEDGGTGVDGSSKAPEALSGLIALMHLDAHDGSGAVVSIPPTTVVNVPGHGDMELWDTLKVGGPSLLIRTVERLTNVRISHYAVLDFAGAENVVSAMHGVDVDVPAAFTSDGFTFHQGMNDLTRKDVLAYVRQNGVDEIVRVELQQNLIRSMLDKIVHGHLLDHVNRDYRLMHALTGAMSVDSDFSNSELMSFVLRLGRLSRATGLFITAPTTVAAGDGAVHLRPAIAAALWRAIRNDKVAAFARQYPSTVTPGDPM